MKQTIDETDYMIEVRKQARQLAEAVEDTGHEPIELINDVLDAHSWFSTARNELSGADYGAIVSDFDRYTTDVGLYRDPETMTEGDDFPQVLRKMAFAEFEADVLKCYELDDYDV